jgi:hypothetical protein
MIARSPKEVYLALNLEGYTNAFLLKFVDLSISDQIEWYKSIGIDASWNYKKITAITYHETNTD